MSRGKIMIKVKRLSKSFNGRPILNDISLEVDKGDILAILGESGAGKSVLLRHLIGLIRPDAGEIEINSINITKLLERDLLKVRKDIGYLFQEGALYDFMDVEENIAFPLKEHTRFTPEAIHEKVKEVLAMVDLSGIEEQYPSELSGGMKKRAALARAIVLGSQILFCDEPTSGLDPIRSQDISDLIQNIARRLGSTVVITSHDIKNSFRIADRLAIMHEGKIIALAKQDQLLKSPDPFVQKFLS